MWCYRSVLIGGISAAAFGVASADGIESSLKDAPIVETYNWSGFYIGAGIGAGMFDHDGSVSNSKTKKFEKKCKDPPPPHKLEAAILPPCTDFETTKTSSHTSSFGDDDWDGFGTIQIGYDRQIHDRFVAGVFADFDFYPDSDHHFKDVWTKDKKTLGSVDGHLELDNVWSVGGRLGYLVMPRLLLYADGGYTQASLDGSLTVSLKGKKDPFSFDMDDDLHGWFAGGGAELKLHKNVSLKLEYRFAEYDDWGASSSGSKTIGPYPCKKHSECKITKTWSSESDFDFELQTVRAALVIRLDEPEQPVAALK